MAYLDKYARVRWYVRSTLVISATTDVDKSSSCSEDRDLEQQAC